ARGPLLPGQLERLHVAPDDPRRSEPVDGPAGPVLDAGTVRLAVAQHRGRRGRRRAAHPDHVPDLPALPGQVDHDLGVEVRPWRTWTAPATSSAPSSTAQHQ